MYRKEKSDQMLNQIGRKTFQSNGIMTCCISLYFIMLPFGAVSLGKEGSVLKFIAVLPCFFFLLIYQRIVLSKIVILQFFLIIKYIVDLCYTIEVNSSIQVIKTNILFLVLLVATGCANFDHSELKVIRNSLVWASRITCIFLIFFGSFKENRYLLSGVITEDPNYLNGYFLFGLVHAVQALRSDDHKKIKILSLLEISIYFSASILTGSRGGLLSLIVSVFLMVVLGSNTRNRGNRKKIIIFLLLMFIFLCLLEIIPESSTSRFYLSTVMSTGGTHRFEIWKKSLEIFIESNVFREIFGYGCGTIRSIYLTHQYMDVVSHNVFIQQILEGGIISFTLYSLIICCCLNYLIQKKDWMLFSCFIGFIVLSLSTSIMTFKPYWNAILIVNLLSGNDRILSQE